MTERERFENFAKPLYDKLRETDEDLDWNWCVRDGKNEFFIWNSLHMAHVTYLVRNDEDWFLIFLSHGTEQATQIAESAFEIVFGGLSAPN